MSSSSGACSLVQLKNLGQLIQEAEGTGNISSREVLGVWSSPEPNCKQLPFPWRHPLPETLDSEHSLHSSSPNREARKGLETSGRTAVPCALGGGEDRKEYRGPWLGLGYSHL